MTRPVRDVLDQLRRELLEQRNQRGHWEGELSPSALSTATAVSALSSILIHGATNADQDRLQSHVASGMDYLRLAQNADGGYGDTDRSHSNIATSYLVLAASTLAGHAIGKPLADDSLGRLRESIDVVGGIDALRRRYGKDKTFVVPILTNLAIAGLVSWDQVPRLPFEAAVFPQSMYRMLSMPVVSYAIPALVAIGQVRHYQGRRAIWPVHAIRSAAIGRTMRVLRRMQPESGGYLEATPLTSFVVMSLAASGRGEHEVSRHGKKFLFESMNEDGNWPIDTNLATWVTSLAMHALACDPEDDGKWCESQLVQWHLSCQHLQRHPFTGAEPGGWGWSDLSGAVPDSDDTPAAIIALGDAKRWIADRSVRRQCDRAVVQGIDWLRRLQNRDGGWPTFCRGWGKLPFDRSSNDLTAHALRAVLGVANAADPSVAAEIDSKSSPLSATAIEKAVRFLQSNQQPDGSWLPLWFGNQDRDDESNPVYGTSRVLAAAGLGVLSPDCIGRGCEYLIASQNSDGGWGGGKSVSDWQKVQFPAPADRDTAPADRDTAPADRDTALTDCDTDQTDRDTAPADSAIVSSVEETALAVDGLVSVLLAWQDTSERNFAGSAGVQSDSDPPRCVPDSQRSVPETSKLASYQTAAGKQACVKAIIRGVDFLRRSVDHGRHRDPWPIGFYFAKLWYHERLYPLIFTTTALAKYCRLATNRSDSDWPR